MHDFDDITPSPPGVAEQPSGSRPLGSSLRLAARRLARETETAFATEGASLPEAKLLLALSRDPDRDEPDGTGRISRGRRHPGRLRTLTDRSLIRDEGDRLALTDEGRALAARLAAAADSIQTRLAGAVTPEAWATTMASLETIARELGDDDARAARPRWHGRRHPRGEHHPRDMHGRGEGGHHARGHGGRRHGRDGARDSA
ncbi:hypothetical protein M4I32_14320 [Microbacterium sp. LRZ72]|uniref:hypothetical protein n=1 Tax=Microbacterium sp. LRZ72 TaxID=2942481 RepID=UPI0029BE6F93|nr:hypothetical protein [Microbacterium sp. LRZ72]MDX2377971.1 hypothetical protein [Microbacterium sp. LRZ72]